MKELPKITCDGCSADITSTGNCEDWRLVLSSEAKIPWYIAEGHRDGAVTLMAIPQPIDRAHHFCGLTCLDLWRDRERHVSAAWSAFWDGWKAAHGTDHGGGMISYPSIPDEIRKSKQSEFERAASAAFPTPAGGRWRTRAET